MDTALLLPLLIVLFLAFANGANDNFKGVATLYGCGRVGFRVALGWATVTTLCGSALALVLGHALLRTFSGEGLVADALVGDPAFAQAVGVGAAATVLLATRLGLPISTTHALVGGLCGAGLAAGGGIALGALGGTVVAPLLFSPLVALLMTFVAYRLFRHARLIAGIREESCVCVGDPEPRAVAASTGGLVTRAVARAWRVPLVAHKSGCSPDLDGRVVGVDAQQGLDALHFVSAGVVGFARGLNDTPKIVALLAVTQAFALQSGVVLVGVAMAVGGLLAARRVAHTLAHRITPMNPGQGFAANLVTAAMVLVASRFGAPVSTTHVSVGALFGIGATTRRARRAAVLSILGAWLVTLPLAALLAAATFGLLA